MHKSLQTWITSARIHCQESREFFSGTASAFSREKSSFRISHTLLFVDCNTENAFLRCCKHRTAIIEISNKIAQVNPNLIFRPVYNTKCKYLRWTRSIDFTKYEFRRNGRGELLMKFSVSVFFLNEKIISKLNVKRNTNTSARFRQVASICVPHFGNWANFSPYLYHISRWHYRHYMPSVR